MAKQRPSVQKREREFKKRERERKKREKAALKLARRQGRVEGDSETPSQEHADPTGAELPAEAVATERPAEPEASTGDQSP